MPITANNIPPDATCGGTVDQKRAMALPVIRFSRAEKLDDFAEPPSRQLRRLWRVLVSGRTASFTVSFSKLWASLACRCAVWLVGFGSIRNTGRDTSGMRSKTGNSLLS